MISPTEIEVPVFREIEINSEIPLRNRHLLIFEGSTRPPGQKLDKRTGTVGAPNFVILIQVEAAP